MVAGVAQGLAREVGDLVGADHDGVGKGRATAIRLLSASRSPAREAFRQEAGSRRLPAAGRRREAAGAQKFAAVAGGRSKDEKNIAKVCMEA